MCAATAHCFQQDLPLLVVMTGEPPTSFERTLSDPTFITQEAGNTLRRDADVRLLGKLSPAEQRKVVASTLSERRADRTRGSDQPGHAAVGGSMFVSWSTAVNSPARGGFSAQTAR